jgi:DNA polymerase
MESCRACPLNQLPYNPGKVVLGIGSINPKLLLIGEAPGATESQVGKPFVGLSGKKLQSILKQVGFTLDDIYITNSVKHRPPDNRTPSESEFLICGNYLKQEIEILNPTRILCVGRVAAYALGALAGVKLPTSGLRGYTFNYKLIPVTVTWHPAYILRDRKREPELVSDLNRLYEELK